jgi:hypothetical protein
MLFEEIKNIQSSESDLRNFGLTIGIALAVIGGFLFWFDKVSWPYFLLLALILVFAGLFIPASLKPLQKMWMAFALVVGWFITKMILVVLFYLVFTPIRLISRLSGKRFLQLRLEGSKKTYWNYRKENKQEKSTYEKQF